MSNTYLTNDQLYLRAPEPEDLELMYRIENVTALWEGSAANVPYSRFALKQYIENVQNDIFIDRQLRLMIVRKEDNKTVGIIDLSDFDPRHGRAAVGIVLLSEYRRSGYATQSVGLLCEYCFKHLDIHQLIAYIPSDNLPSLKLFTQCGFIQSAVLKDWVREEHTYKDAYVMQCIRKND